jgi:hypothetical protein
LIFCLILFGLVRCRGLGGVDLGYDGHSRLSSVGRGCGGSQQNDESDSGKGPQRAKPNSLSHNLWSHRSSQWSFPSGGSTQTLPADSYSVDKIDES